MKIPFKVNSFEILVENKLIQDFGLFLAQSWHFIVCLFTSNPVKTNVTTTINRPDETAIFKVKEIDAPTASVSSVILRSKNASERNSENTVWLYVKSESEKWKVKETEVIDLRGITSSTDRK